MDKLTSIKIKYEDGSYSNQIPVGVLIQNVEYDNDHNLLQVLGTINVESNGTIQAQINKLFNEKVNSSDLDDYVNNQISTNVAQWLAANVTPTGSAVMVDQSLSIQGAAADSKVVGNEITDLKASLTKSVELSLGGRNLLTIPTETYATNGVTYTADGETVTATGTASPNSIYRRIKFQVPISGNYLLSGCPQGGSLTKYYIRLNNIDGMDQGNGVIVKLEAFVEYTLWIVVSKNTVVSDTAFTPRLVWAEESKNTYSSLADMKSDTALMPGAYCVTTGYYMTNDGGGASYLVRSKTTSDIENGGTIHLLNNGYVAELITNTPNTLNIKQWGAKSDGESDISDAYSRCIEYIKDNYPVTYYNGDNGVGGGTIFFPAGRYKATTQLEARHYVEICGENEYTTIITSSASNTFYSSRDDYPDAPDKTGRQNYFRVKNITFHNCNVAIQMRQSIGTIIENCQFISCTRGILLYLNVKVTIKNCLFRGCTNGVFLGAMGVGPSTNVFIEKCWFRHCSGAALKVVGTNNKCGYQPCSLIDTIFEYNNQSVDVEGSETYPTLMNFARCYFEGNTNAGTILNASVFADIQNFFDPIDNGINVTPAEYNKVNISNLSDVYGFTILTAE